MRLRFTSRGLIVMKNVFSSGIQGAELECVFPRDPSQASPYEIRRSLRHVIFTAETHNFPTGHRCKKQTSASCCFFFLPLFERFCDVPPRVDVNLGCAARCGSVQRRHHGDRRSHQRRPERGEGRPRHRRHCRILLRKSAHSRFAKNIRQCAAA